MKRYFFLLTIIMLSYGVLGAQPPLYVNSENGYIVAVPNFESIPLGESFTVHLHVINKSNGAAVNYTECFVHTYDHNGNELGEETATVSGDEYEVVLNAANFSQKGVYEFRAYCNDEAAGGLTAGSYYVTTYGDAPGWDLLIIFIYFLFSFACVYALFSGFMVIVRLIMKSETLVGVISSWSAFILLLIVNHLAKAYLISYFIEDITDTFMLGMGIWLFVLPLISLIITMTIKGFDKKKPLSPQELTGRRRWLNYG